jgi:hypothetical protein
MSYAANVDDDRSRGPWCTHRHGPWHPALIVLMILAFIFWWPLGLAILAFTLWCKGVWGGSDHWQRKMDRMQGKMDHLRSKMGGGWGGRPSSGNKAFDDYRTETLQRLEEEEKEFGDFLDRLRAAKDKAEFDQFMADRRNRGSTGGPIQPQPQPN